MNKKTKSLISIITLVVLIGLFAYYIYKNIDSFKQLSLVNPYYILILVFIFIISYFFIGVITKELLRPFNVKLSYIESFEISIVTGFYNLITPFRGGMAARAVYLKNKYHFSYTDFLSTLSASYVIIFLISSFTGLLSTIIIYEQEHIFSWVLFTVFLTLFIILLIVVLFSPKFPEVKNNYINKFIKVLNGWHLIKNNKRVIFSVSILTLIQILLAVLSTYISYQVFGIHIPFIKCLFLTSVGQLSILVAITPANLGVGEAIAVFSALTIGISPVQSLTVSILGRAVSFITLFILGPLFSYILIKNPKDTKK